MQKICLAAILALGFAPMAHAQSAYQGYTNQHGTYVQPHYQTPPNNTTADNWSTRGNTNPYTGRPGTITPRPTQRATGF